MDKSLYFDELTELLNNNVMVNYEDIYSDFLFTHFYHISGGGDSDCC